MRSPVVTATKLLWLPSLCVALGLAAGCVDGPFSQLAEWNPLTRKQWLADEERGPTYHRRLAELRLLRSQAGSYRPEEQRPYIEQLNVLVRDDSNPVIRAEAVKTLARFRHEAILPGLQLGMEDADPSVRIAACRAWAEIGGTGALQALAEAIARDDNVDVKTCAAAGLAQFRDPAAVEALGVALNESDPALQYQAMRSLRACTNRDFGNNVTAWREYVAGQTPTVESPSLVERLQSLLWR